MTNEMIKKAWNTFKKEIAKEIDLDLTGCCYMTSKQIANHTATISQQLNWSYDDEIAYYLRETERFLTWDGDNKERGERYAREYREKIAKLEARKATHGTRENEVNSDIETITSSAAFKKLATAIGIQSTCLDLGSYSKTLKVYQLRINY
jgi:hypothetical protein